MLTDELGGRGYKVMPLVSLHEKNRSTAALRTQRLQDTNEIKIQNTDSFSSWTFEVTQAAKNFTHYFKCYKSDL